MPKYDHKDLYEQGQRIERQLAELHHRLAALEKLVMALAQDLKDLIAKFDAATDAIAAELADLKSRITNSMSDAEVADVKATI